MTYFEAVDNVRKALATTGCEFYYGRRPEKPKDEFIVWQEEYDGILLYGNGDMKLRTLVGSIDFYCKQSMCEMPEKIEMALRDHNIRYDFHLKVYDADIRGWHYEWLFETEIVNYGD